MPTYISLMTYTDQGLRNVKKSPGRVDAARKAAEDLGGTMGDLYLTMGAYDLVAISEFPDDATAVRRAETSLARYYLGRDRLIDAAALFAKYAIADRTTSGQDRAFGLAGQCGVLSLRGQCDESDAVLRRLWPIHNRLDNRQMKRLLEYAIERNRSKLGQQTAREWDRWLAEQFREGN